MDKELILMIGIPGSGKSTFARRYSNNNRDISIVSSDAIRAKLYGDESIQGNGREVFENVQRDIEVLISLGRSTIILDATNLRRRDRKKYIKLANKSGYKCGAIYCDVSLETAQKRNKQRARQVPDDIIKRMYNALEAPTESEGFNWIISLEDKSEE